MTMGACVTCGGPMKPLFSGFFCPNDCDRKPAVARKTFPTHVFKTKVGVEWACYILSGEDQIPDDDLWYGWWSSEKDHGLRVDAMKNMVFHANVGNPGWHGKQLKRSAGATVKDFWDPSFEYWLLVFRLVDQP